YSYETTETAWHVLNDFIVPAVLGKDLDDVRQIMSEVPGVRGHRMAKASLEMAAWELEARRAGTSLRDLVGGARDRVPVGVSIGLQPTDEALIHKVQGHLDEGYRKIKIKIKPGRDVDMLAGLRERFPDAPFMADANSAYTLDDVDHLKGLDKLGLLMIEQPLAHDDLRDHAVLQRELETPICLDESICSVADARLALELGSGKIINIKPGRVGGFASSVAIHDLCVEHGVPVWCGGMLESGVGRAHNLALASLPGFVIPGDISASRRYWERDIVTPEFVIEDGHMTVPNSLGMGVDPDLDRIEELTTRVEVFEV
ncbi:MAG: o-succinylbenzoate synthase, partial [Gemmatimonadota bacterium]|nr:o-succinylbenzoate synthase [Gemmatimonadota bacterium]